MARTTFAVAAILASLAAGRTYAETPGRRPTVEVVMDIRASAAAPEIAAAQARAGFIFSEAGIRVAWLLRGSEAAGSPPYRCVNRV